MFFAFRELVNTSQVILVADTDSKYSNDKLVKGLVKGLANGLAEGVMSGSRSNIVGRRAGAPERPAGRDS